MSEILVPYGNIYNGHYQDALEFIPKFSRVPFRYESYDNPYLNGQNDARDIIIKEPTYLDREAIPVGIVSKHYTLVQHRSLFKMAVDAIQEMNIDFNNNVHQFQYSRNWETFFFTFKFPEKYTIVPADGHPLDLELVCINSVNGKKRLILAMGWFRSVCANGLFIGETTGSIRKIHAGRISIAGISYLIEQGLKQCDSELTKFNRWSNTIIDQQTFIDWIDHDLKMAWGVTSAVRAFHICQRGIDVSMKPFSEGKPTEKPVQDIRKVPGTNAPVKNAFGIAQTLSWIAGKKYDINERIALQKSIPWVILSLTGRLN